MDYMFQSDVNTSNQVVTSNGLLLDFEELFSIALSQKREPQTRRSSAGSCGYGDVHMSDYTPPFKTEFITDAERTEGAREIMQIIDQVCLIHLLVSRTVYDVTTAMPNSMPIDLLCGRPYPSLSKLSFVHCVQVL
jgi:hypothetical protein